MRRLWLLARRWPVERRFLAALLVEAAWEVIENTPDRDRPLSRDDGRARLHRRQHHQFDLRHPDDVRSASSSRASCRVWASVLLLIMLELIPLFVIRDNLTLNIWTLLAPQSSGAAVAGGRLMAPFSHAKHWSPDD